MTSSSSPLPGSSPLTLTVRVASVETLSPQIKSFRLVAADGSRLPGFEAGAHVQVQVPGGPGAPAGQPAWRSYSLVDTDPHGDPQAGVAAYRIAVRLEDAGRGGSRHMHEAVQTGDLLTLRAPSNQFPLAAVPTVILLAGGIGITPILSMATALKRQGRPLVLHYSARSRSQMVFLDELQTLLDASELVLHADDEPASRLSLDAMLATARPGQPIHVCGPAGLIDATLATAQRLGWRREEVHFELFTEAAPQAGDQAFEIELRSSGRVIPVAADQSALDALCGAGIDVMYDCRAGYCGLCQTGVCSGEIDHRDTYLGEADKAAGRCMQVCVSRARGDRLVLDL